MGYDKYEVKDAIEVEDMYQLLDSLGAEPDYFTNYLACKTICHNGSSKKMYYFLDTKLFYCFSGDCGSFDIFELLYRIRDYDLNTAVNYVVSFCNLYGKVKETDDGALTEDWKIFKNHEKFLDIDLKTDDVVLPEISEEVLSHLPRPHIKDWEDEGISHDICEYMGICYNPSSGGIVIPHRDINGRLVGIRERTLVKEEETRGKYKPSILGGQMYGHRLAFNLYGLDKAKSNIAKAEMAIVVEGEKSCLKGIEYLGTSNNIVVAVCGSSLSAYQFRLLRQCGAREIVIGFDSDYETPGDENYWRTVEKFEKLHNKFKSQANISFLFDKEKKYLKYKDSPFDAGKDAFFALWRDRVIL